MFEEFLQELQLT